jgi:hypothetical protein
MKAEKIALIAALALRNISIFEAIYETAEENFTDKIKDTVNYYTGIMNYITEYKQYDKNKFFKYCNIFFRYLYANQKKLLVNDGITIRLGDEDRIKIARLIELYKDN